MKGEFHIGNRRVGPGNPVYIVAELSGNHNGSLDRAVATIEAAAGLFLCAGLWTPIAGGATAIIGLWSAFARPADPWSQLQLAILGAGLAMLGPGAWSIDARLFGRKRINFPDR